MMPARQAGRGCFVCATRILPLRFSMVSKYVVRYGAMRQLGVFTDNRGKTHERGTLVVVRTNRGLEVGEVLSEAKTEYADKIEAVPGGQIQRPLTPEDRIELTRTRDQERGVFQFCKNALAESGLDMKLVDVDHVFGGERIVVYYLAENRVDFRELVKVLASEFQTRIEMRQIGVRDEAKLLADFGDCGKAVCCNNHLSEMPPVSMKMAKLQKATLDPTKISGRCGRLKCCLRYEYEAYEQLQKELPSVGSEILTEKGPARVLAQEILSSQLLVQTEDSRRLLIEATEVEKILSRSTENE